VVSDEVAKVQILLSPKSQLKKIQKINFLTVIRLSENLYVQAELNFMLPVKYDGILTGSDRHASKNRFTSFKNLVFTRNVN